ncbi:WXG100 family type VII secretion target [Mycolicibacterium arenosum]|uniref:WXG100 family type VII secretion target n=1 Tax=Mycolicibacterium arenosum TaxID=2952157 RepID=A0ABT1M3W2_9MYCO|nr:WXG100 family type VII secretion target [Mycolicibacterium sp. CAU 1645]MCP9273844.1 WXG100 family type VII secretion target [Mycolicibacterium sp. CAU 1645]
MSQPVEVVVSELHSASARLQDAAQRLRDGLAGVNDETTDLLGSGWKGGAASAYAPPWQQWNEGAKKVVEGLQRMSELLDIAGNEYAKTDQSAAASLGSAMRSPDGTTGGATVSPSAGGVGSPTSAGATGTGGSGSGPGASVGQALSSAAQLPQTAVQPLSQAGQAVAGLVQSAAQLASELAEKATAEEDGTEEDSGAAPAVERKQE